jgi:hypothetical protein
MMPDIPQAGPAEETSPPTVPYTSTMIWTIPSEPTDTTAPMAPPVRFHRRECRANTHTRQIKHPFIIPRAPEAGGGRGSEELQFDMDGEELNALIKGWETIAAGTLRTVVSNSI